MNDYRFNNLLRRTIIAVAIGCAIVVACYYWVDRPVAFFVHRDGVEHFELFRWLTDPPPMVQAWSPVVLVLLMIRRAKGPLPRWEQTLFAACVSLIIADTFRTSLGDICGRYWPETWINDNPSLIGTGAYGFHPFVAGDDIGSFPSGHAARIVGFAAVWWLAMPASRVLLVLICGPLLVSLVVMNYHFVGDVVAGSVLGGIIGAYAATLAGLTITKPVRLEDESPSTRERTT